MDAIKEMFGSVALEYLRACGHAEKLLLVAILMEMRGKGVQQVVLQVGGGKGGQQVVMRAGGGTWGTMKAGSHGSSSIWPGGLSHPGLGIIVILAWGSVIMAWGS